MGCSTSIREPREEAINPTTVFAMPYSPMGVWLRLSCATPMTMPSSRPDEGFRG